MSDGVVSQLKKLSREVCAGCSVMEWEKCVLCWKHVAVNIILTELVYREAYSFLGRKAYKSNRGKFLTEKIERGEK
jgi:hypothetical protein